MNFTPLPTTDETQKDEPGVMHIGGPRGRRVWEITRWFLLLCVTAGIMVGLFLRFGASVLWAVGLVGFMIGYMALMGRWAGSDQHRR